MAKLPNVHPGEVLLKDFLEPMEISQNALARAINVPPRRVTSSSRRARGSIPSPRFWTAPARIRSLRSSPDISFRG